jgi:hypothetical protein
VQAPSASISGDVLLTSVTAGQAMSMLPTLPAGWTALPISNQGGQQSILSTDSCGTKLTSWLLAYTRGSQSGDSGNYSIKFTSRAYNTCKGAVYAEMFGNLVAYRGAGQTFSHYAVYGYPTTSDLPSISVGSVSPSIESTLANFFVGTGVETEAVEGNGNTFSNLQGVPVATAETPSSGLNFLEADVPVPLSGGTYGPYSIAMSPANLALGWQVVIPED